MQIPQKQVYSRVRLLAAGILLVLLFLLTGRAYLDFRRSHERGRLVASIVREQLRAFATEDSLDSRLDSQAGWPDDFMLLENWLVLESLKGGHPSLVADRLRDLARRHSYSTVMKTTLQRWDSALVEWARIQRRLDTMSPRELLVEGRLRQVEAMGYLNIGRSYDAAALFLWSSALLTRFIEVSPTDSSVPEALFHLGNSYLRLRHALPARIRGDRILNLCSEMYPDSIWAQRASALWRDEMKNET